tara:strand:+ start:380 stop:967 length:588 start_codon:yes stop_codon:yes gene_type:complete
MTWWSIIKNQIASTKGKTFQLDFNQPMIEEEDNCKERLIKMVDVLTKLDFRDYFRYPYKNIKMPVEDFRTLGEGEYVFETGEPENETYIRYRLFNKILEPFNNITEEAACYILQELKKHPTSNFGLSRFSADEDTYIFHLSISADLLPGNFNIKGGGTYVAYLSIDLLDHYDHFIHEVFENERFEGDISRIFANA